MTNNFEDVMSKRSDADLLKIVTGPVEDYQPAALEAAKKELAKRNLSTDLVETVHLEIEKDQISIEKKANEPLGMGWKLLTLFFPGVLQISFSDALLVKGYNRKAKELLRWTLYGFGFYVALILIRAFLVATF